MKAQMELKVFTVPTCSICPMVKLIAFEVAQKYGIAYREVNMATKEGFDEGSAHQVKSTPSVAIDEEVIVRGCWISKERLEEEVKKRLDKWRTRASVQQLENYSLEFCSFKIIQIFLSITCIFSKIFSPKHT